jgi:hypothetical protein
MKVTPSAAASRRRTAGFVLSNAAPESERGPGSYGPRFFYARTEQQRGLEAQLPVGSGMSNPSCCNLSRSHWNRW